MASASARKMPAVINFRFIQPMDTGPGPVCMSTDRLPSHRRDSEVESWAPLANHPALMKTQATSRRDFLKTVSTAAAAAALAPSAVAQNENTAPKKAGIKLGLDNFAVRDMKWKAPQLIEYAAQLKTDSLFITDFGPFEKFDDDYLRDIRKLAADKGLQIQLGSWSICPTSTRFKKDWGTAEEHLALGMRMAKALGSP